MKYHVALYDFNCMIYFYKIRENVKKEIHVLKCRLFIYLQSTQCNIDNISGDLIYCFLPINTSDCT